MAWNYDYPYVDASQINDDWFLGLAKDIRSEFTDAQSTLNGVVEKVDGFDVDIDGLEKLTQAQGDLINKLRSDVNQNESNIADLTSETDELTKTANNLSTTTANHTQQIMSLTLTDTSQNGKIETNEQNISQNTTDITLLKASNTDLVNRVAKLEEIKPGQNFSSVNIYKGKVDTQLTYPSSWTTCASIYQVEPLIEVDSVRNNITVHCRFSKRRTTKLVNNTIYGLGCVTVNIDGDDYFAQTEGDVSHAYYTAIPVTCALLKDSTGTPTLGGIGTGIIFADTCTYTPTGVQTTCFGFRLLSQTFLEQISECDGFIVEFSYYNTSGGLVSTTE